MRSEAGSSSGSSERGESVVADAGRRRSSCGYCKSGGRNSISHGLWAHSLSVDDYQALLDQGWRRSGCFLYKPEMERTCCPSYTIRLKASNFNPSKEQIRVSRKMQRFLDGTLDTSKSHKFKNEATTSWDSVSHGQNSISRSAAKESLAGKYEGKEQELVCNLSQQIDLAVLACVDDGRFPSDIHLPRASVKKVSQNKKKLLLVEGSEELLYTSNIAFLIAAIIRRAQFGKIASKPTTSGHDLQENMQSGELSPRTIAEILASALTQLEETSGLFAKACKGHINFYSSTGQGSFCKGVQMTPAAVKSSIGGGSRESSSEKKAEQSPPKRRKLVIHLEKSSFDPEEYRLYRKYQLRVHNDRPEQVTESSYRRFLVDTPLIFVRPAGDETVPPCGFGSFHQQYLIDGQLVAVGVFDILPKCLSSKYLFWDPDFAFLSLGKYSVLQEIDWVKENQAHCPSFQYYYLGYYIHSCEKMRYKAAYRPSELLCPLRYLWVAYDAAKPLLDQKPYVVLSDHSTSQNCGPSSPQTCKNLSEVRYDNAAEDDDMKDAYIDDGEEMIETDSDDSDDELFSEPGGTNEVESDDTGNILMGLKGSRFRYKDLRQAFSPNERNYLEIQLPRYMKVVGSELSERMVYLLGQHK